MAVKSPLRQGLAAIGASLIVITAISVLRPRDAFEEGLSPTTSAQASAARYPSPAPSRATINMIVNWYEPQLPDDEIDAIRITWRLGALSQESVGISALSVQKWPGAQGLRTWYLCRHLANTEFGGWLGLQGGLIPYSGESAQLQVSVIGSSAAYGVELQASITLNGGFVRAHDKGINYAGCALGT